MELINKIMKKNNEDDVSCHKIRELLTLFSYSEVGGGSAGVQVGPLKSVRLSSGGSGGGARWLFVSPFSFVLILFL